MLPSPIFRQLFGNAYKNETSKQSKKQQILRELARLHLDLHHIPWKNALDKSAADGPLRELETALKLCKLPALKGGGLENHFRSIALELSACWISRANELAFMSLPPMPNFSTISPLLPGWVRYDAETGDCIQIAHPPHSEDLFFDVEVCPRISKHAVMAVAVSKNAWYFWKSPLFETSSQAIDANCLIPLGRNRLVVGHNVSFDRARVFEEYSLDASGDGIYYLDTMALHCAVAGFSNQQRTLWLKYQKMLREIQKNPHQLSVLHDDDDSSAYSFDSSTCQEDHRHHPDLRSEGDGDNDSETLTSLFEIYNYSKSSLGRWLHHSSPNSLAEAVSLHCNVPLPSKEDRKFFLNCDTLSEIDGNWNHLLLYCATDVLLTHKLFKAVWPSFYSYNPHPATFFSLLVMGKMLLPSDAGWFLWISECESLLVSFSKKLEEALNGLALELIEKFAPEERWKNDPWLRHLDWTIVPAKYCLLPKLKKASKKKFTSSEEIQTLSPSEDIEENIRKYDYDKPRGNSLFFGKPLWYKKLWNSAAKAVLISPKMTIVPYLLGMTWEGKPVHHLGAGKGGWSYLNVNQSSSYSPVPSPKFDAEDAEMSTVGSLISKALFPSFMNGKLKATRSPELAELAFDACTEFSFWTSYRSRVSEALAINIHPQASSGNIFSEGPNGPLAILPQICPMGTITRRATDRLWMTSTASSKSSVLGSDLKTRIVAPAGWKFVGADVDAQELWISSIFGDAQFGEHGSTALSWMGLAGNKAAGTDLHSKTASLLGGGATRDLAKIFNYARFYGSGVKFASSLLHSTQPNNTKSECDKIAAELYRQTKGEIQAASSGNGQLLVGGSESYMFNALASLALGKKYALTNLLCKKEQIKERMENPAVDIRTPVLKCRITDALSPWNVGEGSQFSTSRMNWVVQSSAVDYLHLLLTGMLWLCNRHQITARLAITIHDEVRWLVKEEHAIRAAIALQISNLWTRAAFSQAMGMSDLPLAVAFFSTVEIDEYLRKDPKSPCLSPLRKEPLPPGLSYSFNDLIRERRKELNMSSSDVGILSETEILGPVMENQQLEQNEDHLIHLRNLLKLSSASKPFMPESTSHRISIIMEQERFKDHPDYVSKIPPLLEKKKKTLMTTTAKEKHHLEVDEFGDPIRKNLVDSNPNLIN